MTPSRGAFLVLCLDLARLGCLHGAPPPDTPWFTDITEAVGLGFTHDPAVDGTYFVPESIGSGGALLDYDGDGDLDLYLVNGARRGPGGPEAAPLVNRLYRQDADGTYSDVTQTAGVGDRGYGMGVAVGDIEGDGDLDLYVTNHGPDVLYRNDGDGTFTDVTVAAGIRNEAWGCSATFFDFDRDGDLDLFVTNYLVLDPAVICTDPGGRADYCGPGGFLGARDVLYRNEGDATFTDVTMVSAIGRATAKGLGVVALDADGDGFLDLYVANDGEANQLWHNRGDGTFEEVGLERGVALNEVGRAEAGMGVAVGDVDGDGKLDLFVTNLRSESNTLYLNRGEAGFEDATLATGLTGPTLAYTGFGTGLLDFDHDGDLDLVVVNGRVTRGPKLAAGEGGYWDDYAEPNLLFVNEGAEGFLAAGAEAGELTTRVENSRGLAIGDLDDDGDLDLLVTNGGGPARLYRNDAPKRGGGLLLQLIDGHQEAIGARVTAQVGQRTILRTVTPGFSFLSSSDSRVHLAVGDATVLPRLLVEWPDGRRQLWRDLAVDRTVVTIRSHGW